TGFNTGITKRTFFRFTARPVVVDFFVRTARYTHSPTATFVLVNEYHTIFFPFVDRARWTRRHTRRIQAVLTNTRQIHHKGAFKFSVNLLLNAFKELIFRAFFKFTAKVIFPVGAVMDFLHILTGQYRSWARNQ